jgi:hypothetical protein
MQNWYFLIVALSLLDRKARFDKPIKNRNNTNIRHCNRLTGHGRLIFTYYKYILLGKELFTITITNGLRRLVIWYTVGLVFTTSQIKTICSKPDFYTFVRENCCEFHLNSVKTAGVCVISPTVTTII